MTADLSTYQGQFVLLGGGNMGRAMLEGWLTAGLPAKRILVADPAPSDQLTALSNQYGVTLAPGIDVLKGDFAACLVVAVKPQIASAALSQAAKVLNEDSLVISVAAGKTVSFFQELCSPAKIVRTIPNTPSLIGKGATGAFAGPGVSEEQQRFADALLQSVGMVCWVEDEALIDAITALSGSGPAYVFHMVEAMAQAGQDLGLNKDIAMALARQTVVGAGALLEAADDVPSTLRENVTSPGGTTAAALTVLMGADAGLTSLMRRTLQAARNRSMELS